MIFRRSPDVFRGCLALARETTIATELVYAGRVVNLRVDTVRLEDGRIAKREIIEHRGAVALVPIDEKGDVVLVRQYRKAADKELLEIPAGTLEAGEDPLACAHRELQEETGLQASTVELMTSFYPVPGYSTEYIRIYLAKGLQPASKGGDEDEDIEVVKIPPAQALRMIDSGEICDGKTIIGLLTWARYQDKRGGPDDHRRAERD